MPQSKTDIVKQNIAKRLQKSALYEGEVSASRLGGGFKEKLKLRGGVKEQLEQLDQRETELLEEIARLSRLVVERRHSKSPRSSRASLRRSRESLRGDRHKESVSVCSLRENIMILKRKTLFWKFFILI